MLLLAGAGDGVGAAWLKTQVVVGSAPAKSASAALNVPGRSGFIGVMPESLVSSQSAANSPRTSARNERLLWCVSQDK